MISTKTKNVAIFSLIYFLISGFALGFTIYKIFSLGEELKDQSLILSSNDILQQRYNKLLSILKQTGEEREALASYFLTEEKTADFLTEIEQLASTQDIKLNTDSLLVSEDDEKKFDELIIKFSVQGDSARVKNLIQTLETLPYYGRVTQLSLVRVGSAPGVESDFSGKIELTLSLLSYD